MGTSFRGHGIEVFVLISIRSRFAMELRGLRGRGPTMYAHVKRKYGFKGNRESVFAQFCKYVEQQIQNLKEGEIEFDPE